MSMNGYTHSFAKKIGGIDKIMLIERINIKNVTASKNSFNKIKLKDGAKFSEFTFAEGAACYRETISTDDGVACVIHEVEIALDKMDVEAQNALSQIITASDHGIVAIVITKNKNSLLVGYSQELEDERPLRIISSKASSGYQHTDQCNIKLILQSCDNDPAKIINISDEL